MGPTKKALEIETMSGRPSGTVTITTVTPSMKASNTSIKFWLSAIDLVLAWKILIRICVTIVMKVMIAQ